MIEHIGGVAAQTPKSKRAQIQKRLSQSRFDTLPQKVGVASRRTFYNEENDQVRVTYDLGGSVLVIKIFGDGANHTIKLETGRTVDDIAQYWNTVEMDIDPELIDKADVFAEDAVVVYNRVLVEGVKDVSLLDTGASDDDLGPTVLFKADTAMLVFKTKADHVTWKVWTGDADFVEKAAEILGYN